MIKTILSAKQKEGGGRKGRETIGGRKRKEGRKGGEKEQKLLGVHLQEARLVGR